MKTKKVKAKRKISHRIKANVSGWDLREYKKVKKEGRVPTPRWEKIREEWIDMFRKKEITGKSVWKKVGINDEWCAEVYLETDYSNLVDEDFRASVLNFASFKVKI